MHIAGLVKEIDKGFSYVPYIGFGKTGREIREKLHNWLQRQRKDKDDQRKLESLKQPGTDIKESKRKDMFEDDSSEEESHKKSKAVDSSDEELGSPK